MADGHRAASLRDAMLLVERPASALVWNAFVRSQFPSGLVCSSSRVPGGARRARSTGRERDHVTSACVLRIGVHGADVVEGLLKNRSAMEAARDCYKAEHGMEPCPGVLVAAALGAGSAMRKRPAAMGAGSAVRKRPAALKGPGGRASKRPAQCV